MCLRLSWYSSFLRPTLRRSFTSLPSTYSKGTYVSAIQSPPPVSGSVCLTWNACSLEAEAQGRHALETIDATSMHAWDQLYRNAACGVVEGDLHAGRQHRVSRAFLQHDQRQVRHQQSSFSG